jgi:hypothetical protein
MADVDVFNIPTKVADVRYPNSGLTILLFSQDDGEDNYWTIPLYHN